MPNELDLSNPNFLDEMDEQQEEASFAVMLAKRQQRTEQSVKQLFDTFRQHNERVNHEIETLKVETQRQKEDAEKALELERKRHRVTESKFGYVTLRELG